MIFGVDTETTLPTNDEPIPRLVSVSISGPTGGAVGMTPWDCLTPDSLASVLAHRTAWTNGGFDFFVLMRWAPQLEPVLFEAAEAGRVHFVDVREKLIDIAEGEHFKRGKYDLGSIAARRAGIAVDKEDPWRKRYGELEGIEWSRWPEEARQYALRDASATALVAVAQEQYAHLFRPEAEIVRKAIALYAETLRGQWTDQDAVAALDHRLTSEIDATLERLVATGLARVQGVRVTKIVCNTNAARESMASWCASQGLTPRLTDKGYVALDAETVNDAGVPDGHPVRDYARVKSLRTLRTKTIPVFRRPIVRTRYDPCKDTARTGSSGPQGGTPIHDVMPWEWCGSNFQNLPQEKGYRECLVARPGHVLVVSDYGGVEQLTNAQNQLDAIGRSPLAEALRAGIDTHRLIASKFLGMAYESYDKECPGHILMRKIAKVWNFGRWGGMGDETFGGTLRMKNIFWPTGKIREHNQTWVQTWDARRYFDWVKTNPRTLRTLKSGRVVPVYDMTHWRSGFTKGRCLYTEACNFPFQHLAAMLAGSALWFALRASRTPGNPLEAWPTSQWLFVHDELVAEVPRERAEAAAAEQEACMQAAARIWCPDVPVGIETQIMERYSK